MSTNPREPGWPDWVAHITAVCGMMPEDKAMLAHWCRLLAAASATPAEVIAATDHVALYDPQPWRPNVLPALKRRLDATKAPPPAEALPCPDGEACAICGGTDKAGFGREATGRVHVPDPDRLKDRHVCVVYCRCPLGRYFRAQTPRIFSRGVECPVLTVDDITLRFESIEPAPGQPPGWRGYLQWWRESAALELAARDHAEEGDRRHGPLLWRQAARDAARKGSIAPEETP